MPMNKAKGNMYPFLNDYPHKGANNGWTMNFIRGECPHQCTYCYMKGILINPLLRLEEKEFNTNLGSGNFIFIGSSIDSFAIEIPSEWIERELKYCCKFNNKYLFQSKNPKRFFEFVDFFPKSPLGVRTVLGTTIETNRDYKISKAPTPEERVTSMISLENFEKMVSIEPIMDFDLEILVDWIKKIKPKFISIGADTKNHNLPEPNKVKIELLIDRLRKFTEVKIKPNLKRLT